MLEDLHEMLGLSEQAKPLSPLLELAKKSAMNLLLASTPALDLPPKSAPAGRTSIASQRLHNESAAQARSEIEKLLHLLQDPKLRVNLSYDIWKEPEC